MYSVLYCCVMWYDIQYNNLGIAYTVCYIVVLCGMISILYCSLCDRLSCSTPNHTLVACSQYYHDIT